MLLIQASKKRKTPDLVESSVVEMSRAFSNYVSQKKQGSEATQTQPSLKYNYIWQNLDNLFQQMSQEDVNELNLKFITQAFEKLQSKQQTI